MYHLSRKQVKNHRRPQQLLIFRSHSRGWGIDNLFFAIKGAWGLPHTSVSMHSYTSANCQEHPRWNNKYFLLGPWTVSGWPNPVSVTSPTYKKPKNKFYSFLRLSVDFFWHPLQNIQAIQHLVFCFFNIIPLEKECFKEICTKWQLLWASLKKLHMRM